MLNTNIVTDPTIIRCERLWATVFRQAVDDLDSATHHHKVSHWFISNATHHGSFLWLCELFNLSADVIRRKLKHKIYKNYLCCTG